jgi:uncharacterized protein
MDRRALLKLLGFATAGASLASTSRLIADVLRSEEADPPTTASDQPAGTASQEGLPKRPLGKMGVEATVLGFGAGFLYEASRKEAEALLNEMLDGGINYLDTASSYGGGRSEELMGPIVKQRRDEAFVATKILQRSYSAAAREFKGSLRRLQTDRVDLLQLHAVNSDRELDQVLGSDGALKAALEAQRDGATRFVGITGHTRPEVISRALERQKFDSVLVPLGLADTYINSFAETVVPKAREQDIAVIAMKTLGMGRYLGRLEQSVCFRYAMNLPISVAIVGMKSRDELRDALAAARDLRPLSDAELAEARDRAKHYANTSTLWWKRT